MKAKVLDVQGNEKEKIDLPKSFSKEIREDIISKVLESKRVRQPYAPSPIAGKQHAAKGKIVHKRKVWRSQYGRGMSRVPRKIMSQRGAQFNWEAAEVPQARGGMRAHPPKISSILKTSKINKKEIRSAFESALSATANPEAISEKYSRIDESKLKNVPFIVESEITKKKIGDVLKSIKTILGEDVFKVAIKNKSVRSGKGKLRGRKYKSNAGLLFVTGKDESLKTTAFDVVPINQLKITDIANEGVGRLTMYTDQAIKELSERIKNENTNN